jgi:hypothetical protein
VRKPVQRLVDQDLRDLPTLTEDEKLLQSPANDLGAFTRSDPWRVMRITSEFVEGFDALAQVTKGVTVFGSARTGPDDPQYVAARETSRAARAGRLLDPHRRGPRHHGSRQPRREGRRWSLHRLQHRAALRAGANRTWIRW